MHVPQTMASGAEPAVAYLRSLDEHPHGAQEGLHAQGRADLLHLYSWAEQQARWEPRRAKPARRIEWRWWTEWSTAAATAAECAEEKVTGRVVWNAERGCVLYLCLCGLTDGAEGNAESYHTFVSG